MEENELNEELEPQEETTEEDLADDASPEDYKEYWEKKVKTLEAQKNHWKKKATQDTPDKKPDIKKDTNKNESLSSDDVISLATIVASGVHPDVLKEARDLAKLKGISVKDALELPTVKAYAKEIQEATKKEKAQLSASGGSSVYQDFKKPLTPEEHRKLWEKTKK
jgi:hypothetical protein